MFIMNKSNGAEQLLLQESIRRRLPEARAFLRRLVEVNSFTANREGVNRNAELIMKQFANFSFRSERRACPIPGTGDHLLLDSGAGRSAVACVMHLDTVYSPDDEREKGFHWKEIGNRLYGPGTFDMKGGTVLLWLMLSCLRETLPDVFESARWILLWNAAEECLADDFFSFAAEKIPSDVSCCLVFEGDGAKDSNFAIVHGRKGYALLRVSVEGRSAHAGNAHEHGANAIRQLARFIESISQLTNYDSGLTINFGTVRGGSVTNRVPDFAEALVDVRFLSSISLQTLRDGIGDCTKDALVRAASDGYPCQIRVDIVNEVNPWTHDAATDRLLELWKAAAAECGFRLDETRRGGVSDANRLASRFPTLDGLGPRGGNEHVAGASEAGGEIEFSDASSFIGKVLINCVALCRLLAEVKR